MSIAGQLGYIYGFRCPSLFKVVQRCPTCGVPWYGGRKDVKSCTAQGTNAVQIMTKKRRNALKTIKLLNICSGDKMLIFNGFVLYFDVC